MTPEETARIYAIEQRLEELSERLALLEGRRVVMPRRPAARPVEASVDQGPPSGIPVERPVEMPRAETAAPGRQRFETAVGLTWISRIAVITVVLALAFFFEYAFENHWINETARVLLGLGCGAAALIFGEVMWRKGQRTYAQSLTAAGIAFVYLSIWAAFALYHLIEQPFAFAAMLLATGAAGALSLRYDAPAVAMLGLAGGYATPLLLGSAKDSWFVLAYALVLDAGAAFLSRVRGWRLVEGLAVAGTTILYLSQSPAEYATLFVLAYYALFAASRRIEVAVTAQILAGAALVALWPGVTGCALAWLVAAAGLVVADRRGSAVQVSASFAGFWLAYALWHGESGTPPMGGTLGLITGAYLMFLGWPVWRTLERRQPLRFQELIVLALNTAFYFGTAYGLLRGGFEAYEGIFAVTMAVLQAVVARLLWVRDQRGSLLAAGAAWVLLVLAAPIQFTGYRITVAWALEGAAVVWIGTRFREMRAVYAAAAVFVLVVGRLMNVEGVMYPNPAAYEALFNARFLTFAAVAVALWASAWWIREGLPAGVSYIGGHVVMLWGLSLEAAGWAGRTAAPQNLRSVTTTSLSVLAAAYAVLLVAGGAARGHAITRICGIVLIGCVVAKLYLYDVWLLGQFYRMAAFAILGVLLLTMSYLYSRRRV